MGAHPGGAGGVMEGRVSVGCGWGEQVTNA